MPAPFDAAVYRKRLDLVYARMSQRGIHALYLPPSGDLEYLTGFRRRKAAHTDIVQPADWMFGALITPYAGVYVLAPYMVTSYAIAQAAGKAWINDVVRVPEHGDPMAFLAALPRRFGLGDLHGITLAVGNRIAAETVFALNAAFPGLSVVAAGDIVSQLRQVKGPDELALMRHAAAIADRAFEAVLGKLKPGITDLDVATEVDYQLHVHGAEWTSFPTGIVFSGKTDPRNAEESREVGPPARRRLEPGMHIAFDFGAVYQGYCSDFGRTVFCGEPSAEERRIHDLVMAAQAAGMAEMRADQSTGQSADNAARSVLAAAGYAEHFWHRLGHGIGCDVHEPPFLTASEQRTLQSGMTFTVEPSVLKQGVAIRVEDVVLVTPTGGESLNHASHDLIVI